MLSPLLPTSTSRPWKWAGQRSSSSPKTDRGPCCPPASWRAAPELRRPRNSPTPTSTTAPVNRIDSPHTTQQGGSTVRKQVHHHRRDQQTSNQPPTPSIRKTTREDELNRKPSPRTWSRLAGRGPGARGRLVRALVAAGSIATMLSISPPQAPATGG